ncbi:hypothetical protein [Sanguibacter suaedae]|uniref:Uncharacterized protein n=1 Tax=Sanguibacter suaedae TaxID=2795737 RepID=A0A934I7N3_9MICO|nr:hypothetical protein [Sanguibacter suaedae]MBI9113720.1 hypothetical protein [Sanguibacter suaedae]
MTEALHVVVDGEHVRRSFGMLTGFILAPETTDGLLAEFAELPVEERVCLLASTRTMWHIFAKDAATLGAYGGSTETAVQVIRTETDTLYAKTLPSAVTMANRLDDALALRGLTHIDAALVDDIGDQPAHALGALGYFLRATSIAIFACAVQRGCPVPELLAAVGHKLALAA